MVAARWLSEDICSAEANRLSGIFQQVPVIYEADMRKIPSIKSVMTPFPYCVDVNDTVNYAYEFLNKHQLGHLPIKDGQELRGVVSKRDIHAFLLAMQDTQEKSKVSELKIGDSHIVDLNERLDHVLEAMAERHLDSALVTRNGNLAGIFTSTDVCNTFAAFLKEQFGPGGGNEAA